jgi:hypothetical protein
MNIKKKQDNSDTKKNAKGPKARQLRDLAVKRSEKVQGGVNRNIYSDTCPES